MYTPAPFAVEDPPAVLADLLVDHAASVVSADAAGPMATVTPLLLAPAGDGGSLVLQGHLARANPHAKVADGTPTVVTVVGAQGYVSPSWYPSKAEHGRVVPTWDYVAAVAVGTIRTVDDPAWVVDLVTRLTERHERGRPDPWSVADTPDGFVAKQARAIVGVELVVERLDVKAKLSQNRPEPDQHGVVAGLRADGPRSARLAAAVEAATRPTT